MCLQRLPLPPHKHIHNGRCCSRGEEEEAGCCCVKPLFSLCVLLSTKSEHVFVCVCMVCVGNYSHRCLHVCEQVFNLRIHIKIQRFLSWLKGWINMNKEHLSCIRNRLNQEISSCNRLFSIHQKIDFNNHLLQKSWFRIETQCNTLQHTAQLQLQRTATNQGISSCGLMLLNEFFSWSQRIS